MTHPNTDPLGLCGTTIAGKYRLVEVVGVGGFSVVYKAEHTIWRQPIAIKCFKIHASAAQESREQFLDDFIQEGKLMASLSSRSAAIVQARDVGTFTSPDGTWIPYIVLEWLDGLPLDVILHEEDLRGLPPRQLYEVMALLEPAAHALEVAHSANVAHRDVKPANIMIQGDARGVSPFVKVLDFGIAKVMADVAQEGNRFLQTGEEITAFTPTYGAPEQFSRTYGATGPWTDVFAMALVFVEMLRGKGPVLGGTDHVKLALASRDPNRRPTPHTLGIDVPIAVEKVFQTALAVDPQNRYRTMGAFWTDLHHAVFPEEPTWQMTMTGLGPSSGLALPFPGLPDSRAVTTLPRTSAPPPVTTSGGKTSPRRSIRNLAILAGAAVIALGAADFAATKLAKAPIVARTASLAQAFAAMPARVRSCPAGTVLVPGGKFFMGSDDGAFKLWQPSHKVLLDGFCIDVNEVTAGEYKACSDKGDCKRPDVTVDYPKSEGTSDADDAKNKAAYSELCNFGKEGREDHPINCIPWALAAAYCKEQKKRLPTEAEWEYAARGSDGRKFPWGDDPRAETRMNACGKECNAWEAKHALKLSPTMYDADDGFAGTAPVGSFPSGKTRFGANDFVGNVWEWTADWFETYKPEDAVNPTGAPAGDRKAIRGGGFNGGVELWLNPAFRYHQIATARSHGIGFRCAMSL